MAVPTMNTYVSDMIALENHMLAPLASQASDAELPKHPEAQRWIVAAESTVRTHIAALERRLDALGGHAGVGVKTGVASAVGAVAAAINHVRKTEFSKSLRDDYASLSFAAASYTTLHTTALGFGDRETADLAKQHLKNVAAIVLGIAGALPTVVLHELREEGATVDVSVAATAKHNAEEAWAAAGQHATT